MKNTLIFHNIVLSNMADTFQVDLNTRMTSIKGVVKIIQVGERGRKKIKGKRGKRRKRGTGGTERRGSFFTNISKIV